MKKNRGFSLIELLIAITILAIIMVMISGFMTSTVNSHTKNRREMQVQDEAMRIYSQVADMIMQATYVRITSADGEAYQYNKTDKKFETVTPTVSLKQTFVPDNYCNYELNGQYADRKVIVDYKTYNLVDENNKVYPNAGPEQTPVPRNDLVDKEDITNNVGLQSFRALYQQDATDPDKYNSYYIKPEYIYIEYSDAYTKATTTEESDNGTLVNKVTDTQQSRKCLILKYDETSRKLYMYRYTGTADVPKTVGYYEAKDLLESQIMTDDQTGYISDKIKYLYLTARPDDNSLELALQIEDAKNEGFVYNLKETVNIRNNNVLTVKPQLKRKKINSTTGGSGSGGSGTPSEGGGGSVAPPEDGGGSATPPGEDGN